MSNADWQAMPSGADSAHPQPGSDEGLIARLRRFTESATRDFDANMARLAADRIAAQAQEIAELRALCERLKLEAQCHAQEARTANATIAEIYKVCTGATGEPGNWHGAEPVKAALAEARKDAERLDWVESTPEADIIKYIDGSFHVEWFHPTGDSTGITNNTPRLPTLCAAIDSARTAIARGEGEK